MFKLKTVYITSTIWCSDSFAPKNVVNMKPCDVTKINQLPEGLLFDIYWIYFYYKATNSIIEHDWHNSSKTRNVVMDKASVAEEQG